MLHFPPECPEVPARIPTCIVGLGPGGFIGPTAHGPNLLATNTFNLLWAGTEPKTNFHVSVARNLRVPQANVGSDLEYLFNRMIYQWKSGEVALPPVADITTPTGLHAGQIKLAARKGIRHIITDKPPVAELAEVRDVRAVLRETGAKLFVTFNHRFNAIVAWLRAYVAKYPERILYVEGGFLQDWLAKQVTFRQAAWRTAHKYCALLDILTHAEDLASYVAGSPIVAVDTATVQMSKWAEFYDAGSGRLYFENGMKGWAGCSQSLPGHADDIYVCVHEKDGRKLMWRLEWNPDALFVGHPGENQHNRTAYNQCLRGHSSFFADELGDAELAGKLMWQYGKNPPGHIQGWDTLWYFMFLGIAGAIYRDLGLPCVPYLPACMQIEPAMFEDAGAQSVAYVHAHVKSAESGGSRVELAEVLAV
jgi:predicted dehydrogenase